jgi:hypothetical protein
LVLGVFVVFSKYEYVRWIVLGEEFGDDGSEDIGPDLFKGGL